MIMKTFKSPRTKDPSRSWKTLVMVYGLSWCARRGRVDRGGHDARSAIVRGLASRPPTAPAFLAVFARAGPPSVMVTRG
jgi:hypothetical protein